MTILSNAYSQRSSLAFVRILVRSLCERPETLSPEMREYAYEIAHEAARFAQQQRTIKDLKPEAIELAYQIVGDQELVKDLSEMGSAQEFNKNIAQRLMNGFQRYAFA